MVTSLRANVCMETKRDELRAGRVWAAGFHHVRARSRLARVLKLMNRLFLQFSIFSGRGKQRITETAETESADTRSTCVHRVIFEGLDMKE